MIDSIKKGKANYSIYSNSLRAEQTKEYEVFVELKEAIKSKSFTILYQPIVDTNTMEVYAGEALLRWVHKTKGVLSPGTFLHIMEKTGDIVWVGYWAFEQMIKQMEAWKKNYNQRFKLSLNLSTRQLLEPKLSDSFRKLAIKNHADMSDFIFEIEDVNNYFTSQVAKENIDNLKSYGFQVAIDNFSENFERFTSIDNFPVDMIKIGKSFWDNISSDYMKTGIMETLKQMSINKGIQLIASFVSTSDDVMKIKNLDIDIMQGYIFTVPKNGKDFIGDVLLTPWEQDIKAIYESQSELLNTENGDDDQINDAEDAINNENEEKTKMILDLLSRKDNEKISDEEILEILKEKIIS